MMTDELIEIMKTDPDLAELGTHIRSGHLPALVNGVCENALPLFCRAVTKYAAAKPLIIVPDEKSAYGLAKRRMKSLSWSFPHGISCLTAFPQAQRSLSRNG